MTKRATAFLLALLMVAQVLVPGAARAEKAVLPYPKMDKELVEVGKVDGKDYPKLTNKVILDIQKQATENSRKHLQKKSGATAFNTPYLPGQDIPDKDKPRIVGKVSADFKTIGLDGGKFDWEGVFGKDSNGNLGKAKLVFKQWLNNKETGRFYELEVSRDGKYSWTDWTGEPARIPLYSEGLEAYTYSAYLDQDVSEKVKLLTYRIAGTPGSAGFEKDPETGLNVANIVIDLSIQQVASTKFVSEWHTGLAENARPPVNGEFDNKIDEYPGYFPFSTKDGGSIIIRNDFVNNSDYEDPGYTEYSSSSLVKTPEIKVAEDYIGDDAEGNPISSFTLDEDNQRITFGEKIFSYKFEYDVINGGKLTMTEILPVTFYANGGKFASITEEGTEQKIVKEVQYEHDLTEMPEKPTKDRETFKGWATAKNGTPLSKEEFEKATKNITEVKTFYAIWDNNDIEANELEVKESFKDGNKWINDFIPKLDQLKGQVKIKDANGNPQDLATGDTFAIVDGTNEYTTDDQLKTYLYDKLKEKDDGNKPSRTETVKAKITHKNGTSQTVDIPIKVIKNIYEAKTKEGKPVYVPENYVKVTLDPTTKATNPQKTYYYVNPDAKVVIPGKDPTGTDGNVFTKWTMKADSATGDGEDYNLPARHQFGEASTITAQYEKEKQGTINIKYVDENGKEIDPKYHKDGVDYPATKEGKLGDYADDRDYPKPGPDFKGYIYSSRESIKGKKYKDPTDPDNLDIVKYSYFKKVTTDTPSNKNVYFPVIFDANEGEFESDHKDKKTVYVYFDGNDATVEKVTFKEVLDEFEKVYSNPTKDGFDFKEWQNAKTDGTKPADDYEIKFKGWDSQTYEAIAETFYAHYEQASAFVKYLDLNGKPIGDEFKIDGVEYPTEKDGKLDEAIASDVFTADTAPKLIGYKFNRIELNPANSKYALDNKATIKIYYEKLPDVIPEKDGTDKPNEKPDGYVEVKFVPTDKAKDKTAKIFYVNPKREVTIPIANPEAKATYTFKEWKMGANADGAVYTPSTAQKFTEATTVITATYEETENIIPYDPSETDPMPRPEEYVRVTFAADPGLKLTESKAYYVKANAGITLGNAELKKPAYEAETGYKFDKWDKEDSLVIEAADILVTANATKLPTVIPEKDDDGKPNEKPEGYKEVNFVIKDDDKTKGFIDGVAKFYVNPNEYVTINPPATKAETGFEFGAWDKDAKIPTVYKDEVTTITGSFNGLKDIIPKTKEDDSEKPAGYVTVTFELEKLDGKEVGEFAPDATTVYYVNPNKDVYPLSPTPITKTGYKFKGWTPQVELKKYSEDTTIKGRFEKLPDIIPGGPEIAIPKGYVTVTFLKGDHGELSSQTVYYVNPEANKKMADIIKPTVTPETGYKFVQWSIGDDELIKTNKRPVAGYKALDDVIPKTKDDDSEKPDGYITVTFVKGEHGKELIGQAVYYVNPNKAVVLKDKAPTAVPNTGYKFARWDVSIDQAIQYKDGAEITALYNDPGNISKTEVDGYVKVEFKEGDHGSLEGTTNYWIKPGVEVNIPAPTVKPKVGYKFDKWDKDLTVKLEAKDSPYKITAGYTDRGNIIPQKNTDGSDKPDGYHTVTFKADANGSLSGTTVYYVKPNTDIDLTNTADAITKKANVGYTADGGTWDPVIVKKQFAEDATYTFNFKALDDVIEKIDENTKKPDGYVTVKVVPTDKATDKTEKTYYVNPTKEVTIPFAKPTGKAVSVDASNPKAFKWIFTKWTSDESPTRVWDKNVDTGFKAKFTNDTTVTAQYEQSITDQGTVIADEITVHESFKDGDNWVNNFIDTEATETILKEALKVNGSALPDGATVQFFDDEGNAFADEAAFKAALYEKLKEKDDGNEPSRVEKLKAKVKFKNGEVQNVEIPIKVIKNIYKANTDASKPSYVPDGYVKVTVDPTMKAKDPQKYTYYVNPAAKVVIPGEDPEGTGDNKFVKWTIGDTEYKLADKPRHQFSGETTIEAQYVSDVIPQEGTEKPKDVPSNFVEVKFVPTDNGTMKGPKTFWVNPDKEVTISVKDPVGKQYFTFKEWKIGVNADGAVYNPSTPTKFTDVNGTTITATYTEAETIIPYDPNEPITKPDGYVRVIFAADPGLKLTERKAYYVKKNAGITLGNAELVKPNYTEDTGYKFKEWDKKDDLVIEEEDIVVTAKATELAPVIPEKDGEGNLNDKPEGYVTVTFEKGAHGALEGKTVYYVNPKVAVVLEGVAPKVHPNAGYESAGWDISINQAIQYTVDTTITALYNNPSDISTKEIDGYVKVEFKPGEHGSLSGPTTYWVKPGAEVYLPSPTVKADDGYRFDKWDRSLKVKFEANAPTYVITAQYEKQKPVDPTPDLRPYPVPGDCNNTCDQPNAPNQPNQPNQPNVGKDALNTTDHYQYLIGYPDGNFNPNKGMTRAEAATMFTRLLNERPVKWRHYNAGLSDIRPGDWYANTVGYAVQRGIVSGYPDGSFKPNKPITRAEFAAIASRFDALAQGNAISFSDLAPSHWGYNAIRSAATKGWISGYPDNTFRPEQAITRAEVTAITNRMLNRHADLYWIDAHPSEVIRFGDVKRSDWYFEPIMEATMGHDFIRDRDKKTEHWTGINGKSFI